MKRSKYIVVIFMLFCNAVYVTLSFMPYSKVRPAYKPLDFKPSKEQQIEKAKNAERLIQLQIEQKIVALEK